MQLQKWLYPGMKFKRWLFLFAIGTFVFGIGVAIAFNYKYLDDIEDWFFYSIYSFTGSYDYIYVVLLGIFISIIGISTMLFATRNLIRSLIAVILPDKLEPLVDLVYRQRRLNKGPNMAVVGGGTGLSVLLRGVKETTKNVTAVVTVADDGGSSGLLRRELNIIPPGDLRNCLVALADIEPMMEKLFQYRFPKESGLSGHSFGNLFIAAMTAVTGDTELALKESSKVLAVRGSVFPATTSKIRLMAQMKDGRVIEGESNIPEAGGKIEKVTIFPEHVKPVESAIKALKEAEVIVLGPGSLYTSVIPNLLVDGIKEAILESNAVKIYICNVMTQPGETDEYTASMHVKALQEHGGAKIVDYILVNNKEISQHMMDFYARKNQFPVDVDVSKIEELGVKCFKADIIDDSCMIHHDSAKLARNVLKIYNKAKAGL